MKNYKSIVFSKKHLAGSTGAVIEVYDKSRSAVARFDGLKRVYDLTISPCGKLLCAKSAMGYFLVYSLETLSLLKKVEIEKNYDSVDGAMIFSSDSGKLYNVEVCSETVEGGLCTVAVYDTDDFSLIERIEFCEDMHICDFEYDQCECLVIGYVRGEEGYSFVAKLCDGAVLHPVKITKSELDLYTALKCLENRGHKSGRFVGDVERFIDRGFSLAKLYEYRKENEIQ